MIFYIYSSVSFIFLHIPLFFSLPIPPDLMLQDQTGKDLSLPLVDSHAQHLIQKRIAIEKLTRRYGEMSTQCHGRHGAVKFSHIYCIYILYIVSSILYIYIYILHIYLLLCLRVCPVYVDFSLGVVLGPLCLTMSDVFSDLSSLVRTFRSDPTYTNSVFHMMVRWCREWLSELSDLSDFQLPEYHV